MTEGKDIVPGPLTNKIKYLSTAAIFLECITYGCAANFYSPVLVDLKNRYNTDIATVSRIFIIFMGGYLVGTFSGGQLFSRVLRRQHGVVLAFGGIATSLFLTPHCPSLLMFFLNGALLGISTGIYDTAQIVWMIEMWQSKAGPYIQAQHFCWALGSNIPIFLVTPFLGQSETDNIMPDNYKDEEYTTTPSRSNLVIPFTIAAGLATCNILYELFLITCYRYEKPEPEVTNGGTKDVEKSEAETKSDLKSSKLYRGKLILLSGLFMGFCVGMEMCSMQFIPTLAQYGDLKLSEAEGALVLTGVTGAFTVGRAIGILITFKVSPQIILVLNLVFVGVGNAALLLWANSSYQMLWFGCISLGLGYSTMYASFYTFMSRNLVFTDQVGSLMLVSGSIVGTVYPLIVGKYIEQSPVVLTYTNFLSLGVCSVVFLIAWIVTSSRNSSIAHKK